MTRVEAYRLMLESKQVIHKGLPGSIWSLGPDREIRTNSTSSDWSQEFFNVPFLCDGWELHDES